MKSPIKKLAELLMDTPNELRMDKTKFSVAFLHDESDEKTYWRNQTPAARLEALELMRQVMYGYDPASVRLQRVLEVVKRTPE